MNKTKLKLASSLVSSVALLVVVHNYPAPQPIADTNPTSVVEVVVVGADKPADNKQSNSIQTDPQDSTNSNRSVPINPDPAQKKLDPTSSYDDYSPVKSIFVNEKLVKGSIVTETDQSYPSRTYTSQVLPNDPSANQAWVQSARLPELWSENTGTNQTLLAIIDTGFALEHEEFAGRWHVNAQESGLTTSEAASKYNCTDRSLSLNYSCNLIDDNYDGIVDNESGVATEENPSQLNCTDQLVPVEKSCNMIDDDDNGLVDDWRGWDFMNFDRSVAAGDVDPAGKGTKHGSYVTGIAAANANNGVGIAGVNWQTKILPIQALGDSGSGNSISVARGIRYAVNQGADVISLSLGGASPDSFTRQAVQEAIAAGVIIVAASGNDGCNCISYPANYPEVLAVGALDQSNNRASFSSYGVNLDILAPGTNIYTTTWTPSNQTSAYIGGIAGTSLATPIVSGAVTALVGEYPDLSPREIIAILTENTNRLSISSNASWSSTLGYGALDAFSAHRRPVTPHSPAKRYDLTPISYGNVLFPNKPVEPISKTDLYRCTEGQYGTSRVYRLYNGAREFYSASDSERFYAKSYGYDANFFGYACVGLPIDKPAKTHLLNILSEFGRFTKP